jgi:hypothetical protein
MRRILLISLLTVSATWLAGCEITSHETYYIGPRPGPCIAPPVRMYGGPMPYPHRPPMYHNGPHADGRWHRGH